MEIALRHLFRIDNLPTEPAQLHGAEQVSGLVQRSVAALERTQHLRSRSRALVSTALDEEIDGFLWRPLPEVELERKDDSRAAVHPPEQRADAILRRRVEAA